MLLGYVASYQQLESVSILSKDCLLSSFEYVILLSAPAPRSSRAQQRPQLDTRELVTGTKSLRGDLESSACPDPFRILKAVDPHCEVEVSTKYPPPEKVHSDQILIMNEQIILNCF